MKEVPRMIVIWLIILSIISIASLVRTFYHDVTLGIDYSGILVGILAALCTVLIGWQIYSLVDFDRREQKNLEYISSLKSIVKGMQENRTRGDYLMHDNLAELYKSILENDKDKYAFEFLHFKINAMNYASRINDYETCQLGIKNICLFISLNDLKCDKEQKDRLLKFACLIPNQNMIENFTDLVNALGGIKI